MTEFDPQQISPPQSFPVRVGEPAAAEPEFSTERLLKALDNFLPKAEFDGV